MFVLSLKDHQSFLKNLEKTIKKLRNREKSLKKVEKTIKNDGKYEKYDNEPPKNGLEGGLEKKTPPYASPPS